MAAKRSENRKLKRAKLKINAHRQGAALLTVLLLLALASGLLSQLLLSAQLQFRMSSSARAASQQRQAAEAGLRWGERQLAIRTPPPEKGEGILPHEISLPPRSYAEFLVIVTLRPFARTFCLLPVGRLGHIWEITATARGVGRGPLVLQSTFGQAETIPCSRETAQPTALMGRSSWRELSEGL